MFGSFWCLKCNVCLMRLSVIKVCYHQVTNLLWCFAICQRICHLWVVNATWGSGNGTTNDKMRRSFLTLGQAEEWCQANSSNWGKLLFFGHSFCQVTDRTAVRHPSCRGSHGSNPCMHSFLVWDPVPLHSSGPWPIQWTVDNRQLTNPLITTDSWQVLEPKHFAQQHQSQRTWFWQNAFQSNLLQTLMKTRWTNVAIVSIRPACALRESPWSLNDHRLAHENGHCVEDRSKALREHTVAKELYANLRFGELQQTTYIRQWTKYASISELLNMTKMSADRLVLVVSMTGQCKTDPRSK